MNQYINYDDFKTDYYLKNKIPNKCDYLLK